VLLLICLDYDFCDLYDFYDSILVHLKFDFLLES
jgi:hypothetical protein